MNTLMPKFITASMLGITLFAQNAEAGVLIDNFTDFQAAEDDVAGPMTISGTNLSNVKRTLTATPSLGGSTEIVVEDGLLNISNNTDSAGTASIYYSFNTIDLSAFANSFELTSVFNDTINHGVTLIANDSSTFAFQNLSGIGDHYFNFSQFSDPSVFTNLTSLEMKFQGDVAWDAQFSLMTVPEPSITALLTIGLVGIASISRRKIALVKSC